MYLSADGGGWRAERGVGAGGRGGHILARGVDGRAADNHGDNDALGCDRRGGEAVARQGWRRRRRLGRRGQGRRAVAARGTGDVVIQDPPARVRVLAPAAPSFRLGAARPSCRLHERKVRLTDACAIHGAPFVPVKGVVSVLLACIVPRVVDVELHVGLRARRRRRRVRRRRGWRRRRRHHGIAGVLLRASRGPYRYLAGAGEVAHTARMARILAAVVVLLRASGPRNGCASRVVLAERLALEQGLAPGDEGAIKGAGRLARLAAIACSNNE